MKARPPPHSAALPPSYRVKKSCTAKTAPFQRLNMLNVTCKALLFDFTSLLFGYPRPSWIVSTLLQELLARGHSIANLDTIEVHHSGASRAGIADLSNDYSIDIAEPSRARRYAKLAFCRFCLSSGDFARRYVPDGKQWEKTCGGTPNSTMFCR